MSTHPVSSHDLYKSSISVYYNLINDNIINITLKCLVLDLKTDFLFVCLDEVAVIDEIQMIRDPSRGWAWTRALLGL